MLTAEFTLKLSSLLLLYLYIFFIFFYSSLLISTYLSFPRFSSFFLFISIILVPILFPSLSPSLSLYLHLPLCSMLSIPISFSFCTFSSFLFCSLYFSICLLCLFSLLSFFLFFFVFSLFSSSPSFYFYLSLTSLVYYSLFFCYSSWLISFLFFTSQCLAIWLQHLFYRQPPLNSFQVNPGFSLSKTAIQFLTQQ